MTGFSKVETEICNDEATELFCCETQANIYHWRLKMLSSVLSNSVFLHRVNWWGNDTNMEHHKCRFSNSQNFLGSCAFNCLTVRCDRDDKADENISLFICFDFCFIVTAKKESILFLEKRSY